MPQFPPLTVALPLIHNTFHWSLGVNNSQRERASLSVLAHRSLSYHITNWSCNDSYLLSRQSDYRNWSYNYSKRYKRMFHWPECHAVLANGNKIGSLRWCVIDFGQMACWFFDYATLLWLDNNQIVCQAQRWWGRLMRIRTVHQNRGVLVKRYYFHLTTRVDNVRLFISNSTMFRQCSKKMQRTQWMTATGGSSITERSSWWF